MAPPPAWQLAQALRICYVRHTSSPICPTPGMMRTCAPTHPTRHLQYINDDGASTPNDTLFSNIVPTLALRHISPEAGPVRWGMSRSPHAFQLTQSPRILPQTTPHTHKSPNKCPTLLTFLYPSLHPRAPTRSSPPPKGLAGEPGCGHGMTRPGWRSTRWCTTTGL